MPRSDPESDVADPKTKPLCLHHAAEVSGAWRVYAAAGASRGLPRSEATLSEPSGRDCGSRRLLLDFYGSFRWIAGSAAARSSAYRSVRSFSVTGRSSGSTTPEGARFPVLRGCYTPPPWTVATVRRVLSIKVSDSSRLSNRIRKIPAFGADFAAHRRPPAQTRSGRAYNLECQTHGPFDDSIFRLSPHGCETKRAQKHDQRHARRQSRGA